ncbi:MAG: hypothetical protein V2A76_13290 [Planctomycetota bacterium]
MDYTIRKISEGCVRCQAPFEAGNPLYSLILLEEEEPARLDLCVSCFELREADPEREFAFWRTRRAESTQVRRMVDFNLLRELFFRMAERESPEYRKICYLLGLVLIRKRVVKLQEFTSEGGVDYLVVTAKQREHPIRLEAPELRPEEFGELRDHLVGLLDMDLGPESDLPAQFPGEDEADGES